MTIYTKSKTQASVFFAENGVAAFGTIFSKATLNDLNDRPDGDGIHQNTINMLANALPKTINYIAQTKVVAKSPDPDDDSYVIKVLVPTKNGTVNDEPIAAGTAVYAAGNSGAIVECPNGKVLEFTFTAHDAWVPKEVAPIGEDADTPDQIPKVIGTKDKKPRGKAGARGDVESVSVSINTDEHSGDVTTPAKVETAAGEDITTPEEATEEAAEDKGLSTDSE